MQHLMNTKFIKQDTMATAKLQKKNKHFMHSRNCLCPETKVDNTTQDMKHKLSVVKEMEAITLSRGQTRQVAERLTLHQDSKQTLMTHQTTSAYDSKVIELDKPTIFVLD